jgi:hypothetical protein
MARTAELLRRNLFEVFGEKDADKRASAIAALYVAEPTTSDPYGEAVGREALSATVSRLHARFPQSVFTQIGEPETHHNVGRIAWGHGAPGVTPTTTGLDVVVVEDGRIARLYTFLDPRK